MEDVTALRTEAVRPLDRPLVVGCGTGYKFRPPPCYLMGPVNPHAWSVAQC